MLKKFPVIPLVLTMLFFVLACSREQSLSDANAAKLANARDSIPRDTTDSTDTLPGVIISTVPDSILTRIHGLQITPSSIRHDSVLRFDIQTTNTYPSMVAHLLLSGRLDSSTIYVSANGVSLGAIAPVSNPAVGNMHGKALLPGSYPLKIKLRGNIYSGSVTSTATQYTFHWTHDSIIAIHPKTVLRVP